MSAATDRLAQYNGGVYDAADNPYGFDGADGGVSGLEQNLPQALNDVGTAASEVAVAAVQTQQDAADVATKHADIVAKHADVVTKHADVVTVHPDIVARHGDVVTKHGEVMPAAAAVAAAHAEVMPAAADVMTAHPDVVAKHADVVNKHAEVEADRVAAELARVAAEDAADLAARPLVLAPTITAPASGAVGVSRTPTLTFSAFRSLYGLSHLGTHVQVSTDSAFATLVYNVGAGAATSRTLPQLAENTTHWARVRYSDADGNNSGWSPAVSFTTIETVIATPTITSPTAGATGLAQQPVVSTSAYSITGGTETHLNTDWQVATDAAFTNVVAQSLADAVNKTSWTVSPALATSTAYYVRARHRGNGVELSAWSAAVSFTTAAPVPVGRVAYLVRDGAGALAVNFTRVFEVGGAIYAFGTVGTNALAVKISGGAVVAQQKYSCGAPMQVEYSSVYDRFYFVTQIGEIVEVNTSLAITAQRKWTNVSTYDHRWGVGLAVSPGGSIFMAAPTNAVSANGGWTIARYGAGLVANGASPRLLLASVGSNGAINFRPTLAVSAGNLYFFVMGQDLTPAWLCMVKLDLTLSVLATVVYNGTAWNSYYAPTRATVGPSQDLYIGEGDTAFRFDYSSLAMTRYLGLATLRLVLDDPNSNDFLLLTTTTLAEYTSTSEPSGSGPGVSFTGIAPADALPLSGSRLLVAGANTASFAVSAGVVIDAPDISFTAGAVPNMPNVSLTTGPVTVSNTTSTGSTVAPTFTWRSDVTTNADVLAAGTVTATAAGLTTSAVSM